jgi:subtilisin family serine protease
LTEALTHYTGRAATNRPGVVCANFSIADIAVASKIDDMINAGMVVVCSVHNYGRDVAVDNFYPAVQADVIGVGGIGFCDTPYYLGVSADEFGAPQIGTGFGTPVDILAPAQSLRLANASVLGGGYRVYSGNSFSCPFVTGAVACMLEGKTRITTRAGVQAVITKLLANATTGKLRPGFGLAPLPDKILYLDPAVSTETI